MTRVRLIIFLAWVCNLAVADIHVVDANGDALILESPAQRIIALSPHIVENLFSIGAGELIVGSAEYADYPEAALAIPAVANYATVNLEAVVNLKADLVIAWGSGTNANIIERVRTLNIPVFIDEPQTLEDIASSLKVFGQLTGRESQASVAAKQFVNNLNQLKSNNTNKFEVSVLYQLWHNPIQTVNNDNVISDVIKLCGGVNLFGDAVAPAPVINREIIIARNPDAIVASGTDEKQPAWLGEWQKWPGLNAVQNNHIFVIPPDILQRFTPRILLGAKAMCEHLDRVRQKN